MESGCPSLLTLGENVGHRRWKEVSMKVAHICSIQLHRSTLSLAASIFLTGMAIFGIASDSGGASTVARQAEAEKRGTEVMPFNLDQTIHVFQLLNDGGQQTVRAKAPANHE
jgi:hypothetical protein